VLTIKLIEVFLILMRFFSIFNSTLNNTLLSQVFQKKQIQGNFPQAIISQEKMGWGGGGATYKSVIL
jgi:hypothetical protein